MADVLTQPSSFLSQSSFELPSLKSDMQLSSSSFESISNLLEQTTRISIITEAGIHESVSTLETINTTFGIVTRLERPFILDSELLNISSIIQKSFITTPPILTSNSNLLNSDHKISGGFLTTLDTTFESQSNLERVIIFGGEGIITEVGTLESTSTLLVSSLKYNIVEFMNTGDNVYLLLKDEDNNFKVYKGKIRQMNPKDRKVKIKAIMGDKILTERVIKENYEEQDIGQTTKEIIETYCSPLTAEHINTSTGFTAPIQAQGKKPSQIFTDLQSKYPIVFFVDFAWNVHFILESSIENTGEESGGYFIRLGDE
jgi:hypothetical protein